MWCTSGPSRDEAKPYLATRVFRKRPVTEKDSQEFSDGVVECGVSTMQGWRSLQEDCHVCMLDFDVNVSLFGIFDGHGGMEVSQLASEMLPCFIKWNHFFRKGDYVNALKKGFLDFDDFLRTDGGIRRMNEIGNHYKHYDHFINKYEDIPNVKKIRHMILSGYLNGTTAIVALLVNRNVLYVANVGDSRCIIAENGKTALDMSKDHRPNDTPEMRRIIAAGGIVINDRINGDLNMSRSLGDLYYKDNKRIAKTKQCVIGLPDVQVRELSSGPPEFIVLASDGVCYPKSNQEIVDFVSKYMNKTMKYPRIYKLSRICEKLFEDCLSNNRKTCKTGLDNMTCMIIQFKWDKVPVNFDDDVPADYEPFYINKNDKDYD